MTAKLYTMKVEPDFYALLRRLAKAKGKPMAAVIREAIKREAKQMSKE